MWHLTTLPYNSPIRVSAPKALVALPPPRGPPLDERSMISPLTRPLLLANGIIRAADHGVAAERGGLDATTTIEPLQGHSSGPKPTLQTFHCPGCPSTRRMMAAGSSLAAPCFTTPNATSRSPTRPRSRRALWVSAAAGRGRPAAAAAAALQVVAPPSTVEAAGQLPASQDAPLPPRQPSAAKPAPAPAGAEKAYLAARAATVKQHFPTALGADDFIQRLEVGAPFTPSKAGGQAGGRDAEGSKSCQQMQLHTILCAAECPAHAGKSPALFPTSPWPSHSGTPTHAPLTPPPPPPPPRPRSWHCTSLASPAATPSPWSPSAVMRWAWRHGCRNCKYYFPPAVSRLAGW